MSTSDSQQTHRKPTPFTGGSFTRYLVIVVFAVVISTVYWSVYGANALSTFHEYGDLGIYNFDMYYHLTYPSVVHGFQYLIFGNHMAPDLILLLPFYALAETPFTLLFIQAAVISLTGLVLFFIVRDLLNSDKIALLFCLAFLLNSGVWGILVFDFHTEFLIPIFFLMSFYFLVKRRKFAYVISLLLLLGTIDIAPIIVAGFGITMAFYAILREKDADTKKSWLVYSGVAIGLALIVFLVYSLISSFLLHAYLSGAYSTLPAMSRGEQIKSAIVKNIGLSSVVQYLSLPGNTIYALTIVFMSFGFAGLYDPLFAILFVSPWLFEVFAGGFVNAIIVGEQYFSYSIAGTAAIAILVMRNRGILSKMVISMIVCTAGLGVVFVHSLTINNFNQEFLFQTNTTVKHQVQQLNSMIALVPANASIMAPDFTMPQLSKRAEFEAFPNGLNETEITLPNGIYNGGNWFEPEYILADFNLNISLEATYGHTIQNFINISGATVKNNNFSFTGNYGIYAYNGSVMLLKLR